MTRRNPKAYVVVVRDNDQRTAQVTLAPGLLWTEFRDWLSANRYDCISGPWHTKHAANAALTRYHRTLGIRAVQA